MLAVQLTAIHGVDQGLLVAWGGLTRAAGSCWNHSTSLTDLVAGERNRARGSMGEILLRQADGRWRDPEFAGYATETEQQESLAEHPVLISAVNAPHGGNPRRRRPCLHRIGGHRLSEQDQRYPPL